MSTPEQTILEYIRSTEGPVSAQSIADATGLSRAAAYRKLAELVGAGYLIESDYNATIKDGTTRRIKVYMASASIQMCENTKEIDAEALLLQNKQFEQAMLDRYASFSEQIGIEVEKARRISEETADRTRKLYIDMITLMGVFISIFALIIINIEAIQSTFQGASVGWNTVLNLLLLNVPLALSIIILLVGIRLILLSPMLRKERERKKEKEDGENINA